MSEQGTINQDLEAILDSRMKEHFTAPVPTGDSASSERLKEMSKKLPEWSLEPPYSFLK